MPYTHFLSTASSLTRKAWSLYLQESTCKSYLADTLFMEDLNKLQLNKHPVPLFPSLFIIGLRAAGNGHLELYHTHNVAYNKVDAIEVAIAELQQRQPALYERGLQIGGWLALHAVPVTAHELEERFNKLAAKQIADERQRESNEKNALLKKILDENNLTLFHEAVADGCINEYQKLYLHDLLTKGDEPCRHQA